MITVALWLFGAIFLVAYTRVRKVPERDWLTSPGYRWRSARS